MLCKCSGKYIDIYFILKITCFVVVAILFPLHIYCFVYLNFGKINAFEVFPVFSSHQQLKIHKKLANKPV